MENGLWGVGQSCSNCTRHAQVITALDSSTRQLNVATEVARVAKWSSNGELSTDGISPLNRLLNKLLMEGADTIFAHGRKHKESQTPAVDTHLLNGDLLAVESGDDLLR